MSTGFSLLELLISPLGIAVAAVLFVCCLGLLVFGRSRLGPGQKALALLGLVLGAAVLLFFLWLAVMWGQPPAAAPVPAPAGQ